MSSSIKRGRGTGPDRQSRAGLYSQRPWTPPPCLCGRAGVGLSLSLSTDQEATNALNHIKAQSPVFSQNACEPRNGGFWTVTRYSSLGFWTRVNTQDKYRAQLRLSWQVSHIVSEQTNKSAGIAQESLQGCQPSIHTRLHPENRLKRDVKLGGGGQRHRLL